MLKVETMSFCNFTIDCFLHPVYGINQFVTPFSFHRVHCPLKLGIDHPHKQKTLFLQFINWNSLNQIITQTWILDCYSSWRLRGWQPPWRIHHQNIELTIAYFKLFRNQLIEIEFGNVCTDWDGNVSDLWLFVRKGALFVEEEISVVSDFRVDLNEEILQFVFLEWQLIHDAIIVEDVVKIGRIIWAIFWVFLNSLSLERLIFLEVFIDL